MSAQQRACRRSGGTKELNTENREAQAEKSGAARLRTLRLPLAGMGSLLLSLIFILGGTLLLTTLVLFASGAPPLEAYQLVLFGAFRNSRSIADMLMLAAPLLLCSAGLTLTFAVGLYNLGIEGQMTLGAIFAMFLLRLLPDLPPPLLWTLALAAGAAGGALWALLVGLLRVYFSVNEIFAGLGLNFIATGVALYLVLGPWARPGVASMSGTEPLPEHLWLPTVGTLRLAPLAPALALLAIVLVWFVLTRTRWGLAVRATGLNAAAAGRLGVPTTRRLFEALAGCGVLAGIAGGLQVLAVFHRLIPNISSGIGFLALLVVLLVRSNPVWVLPVALAFASFTTGSIRLPLDLNIDSSISGVLQGTLVLLALVAGGIQQIWARREAKA
jgi:simple sugar transport system permease protein